jgi:pyruvate kinase
MKAFSPVVKTNEAMAAAAGRCANEMMIDLIVVLTENGNLARLVAKYRPRVPVLACALDKHIIA